MEIWFKVIEKSWKSPGNPLVKMCKNPVFKSKPNIILWIKMNWKSFFKRDFSRWPERWPLPDDCCPVTIFCITRTWALSVQRLVPCLLSIFPRRHHYPLFPLQLIWVVVQLIQQILPPLYSPSADTRLGPIRINAVLSVTPYLSRGVLIWWMSLFT